MSNNIQAAIEQCVNDLRLNFSHEKRTELLAELITSVHGELIGEVAVLHARIRDLEAQVAAEVSVVAAMRELSPAGGETFDRAVRAMTEVK